jgi:hypothetical protein
VDVNRFCPNAAENPTWNCIVYVKRRSSDLVRSALQVLDKRDILYRTFTYGSYNEGEYLRSLQQAKCMIVLDAHESQGFALEEAMSCNVPLLVLDATTMYDEVEGNRQSYAHLYPKRLTCTSVPYWDDRCGIRIQHIDQMDAALDNMLSRSFAPRDYVLDTLSDEVCMRRILNYFGLRP